MGAYFEKSVFKQALVVFIAAFPILCQEKPQSSFLKPSAWQQKGVCGVNAVYFLLKLSEFDVHYNDVLEKTVRAESGSSIGAVCESCGHFGLPCELRKNLPTQIFGEISPPFIAHWDDTQFGGAGHFVVVLHLDGDIVAIADGGTCEVSMISKRNFEKMSSGYFVVPRCNRKKPVHVSYMFLGIGLGVIAFSIGEVVMGKK